MEGKSLSLSPQGPHKVVKVRVGENFSASRLVVIGEEKGLGEFLRAHVRGGMIGLFGGSSWTHRLVRKGQRPLTKGGRSSLWSHAVIFGEEDGQMVVYESDWDVGVRPLRFKLGAQRNPLEKYSAERRWSYASLLDLGLGEEERELLMEACQEMIREGYRYPVLELVNHGLRLRLRGRGGHVLKATELLGRIGGKLGLRRPSLYCSAFVQKAMEEAGFSLAGSGATLAPQEIFHLSQVKICYLREKEWRALLELGEVMLDDPD
jgi:hypothetical protein